ncbi:MAG: helix-turn-helix domain-containing protein [Solirubrobacteraceae bacterium]|jgi:AraC-like DNA-binding protein
MSYREHAPTAALAPWLACTWERRDAGAAAAVRVLPDGCIDIVWRRSSGSLLVGANTTAFIADGGPASTPAPHVVGARLAPGGAPALLGVSPQDVLDQRLDLAHALGATGGRLAAALDEAGDPVAELRRWLEARARHAPAPDPLVSAAVRRLAGGAGRLDALADDLGVSERGLRRRVTVAVGYGPKRLARVLRLRRALADARAGAGLARAAFDAGYADQAHFSNDCRALAGVPPSALVPVPGR